MHVGKFEKNINGRVLHYSWIIIMQQICTGGRRKLQIPPELAYGPEPAGCFSGTALFLHIGFTFLILVGLGPKNVLTHSFFFFVGDCNIPANATLLYDINFVNIYSGNRK